MDKFWRLQSLNLSTALLIILALVGHILGMSNNTLGVLDSSPSCSKDILIYYTPTMLYMAFLLHLCQEDFWTWLNQFIKENYFQNSSFRCSFNNTYISQKRWLHHSSLGETSSRIFSSAKVCMCATQHKAFKLSSCNSY